MPEQAGSHFLPFIAATVLPLFPPLQQHQHAVAVSGDGAAGSSMLKLLRWSCGLDEIEHRRGRCTAHQHFDFAVESRPLAPAKCTCRRWSCPDRRTDRRCAAGVGHRALGDPLTSFSLALR